MQRIICPVSLSLFVLTKAHSMNINQQILTVTLHQTHYWLAAQLTDLQYFSVIVHSDDLAVVTY